MTRVAVIGSRGQLGSDLVAVLRAVKGYDVIPLTRDDIDVTDLALVRRVVAASAPAVVVNCAANVRVDDCEDRPEEAFQINALGALHVARACAAHDALCVYISTDYVFDGEKGEPYAEDDRPRPINVYGASKLAGEYLVQQAGARWLIIRTASLFGKAGARGKGGNFVDTMVARALRGEEIKVVSDIRMSPTYSLDTARALERLLHHDVTGIVHVANTGSSTWFEFARTALELIHREARLEAVSYEQYPMKARRPRNSSLRSLRLSAFYTAGMRPWQDALKAYLVEKGHPVKTVARCATP